MNMLELLLVAAVLAMVSRFALANHRSAAPAGERPWMQVTLTVVLLTAGALLLAGMAVLS